MWKIHSVSSSRDGRRGSLIGDGSPEALQSPVANSAGTVCGAADTAAGDQLEAGLARRAARELHRLPTDVTFKSDRDHLMLGD